MRLLSDIVMIHSLGDRHILAALPQLGCFFFCDQFQNAKPLTNSNLEDMMYIFLFYV